MEFLRCDSCGKPLGEGALGRGEATRRDALIVCSSCTELERRGHALPAAPSSDPRWSAKNTSDILDHEPITEPVADRCGVCGIPVMGEDFIAGKAYRFPSGTVCRHCVPRKVLKGMPSARMASSSAKIGSGRRPQLAMLPLRKKTLLQPENLPQAHHTSSAATSPPSRSPYTTASWLVMLVVLPAFGIALYTAVSRQGQSNDLERENNSLKRQLNEAHGDGGRASPPLAQYDPEILLTPVRKVVPDAPGIATQNPNDHPTADMPLPESVTRKIAQAEIDLARPLVQSLESADIDERLRALGEIIAERAIGAIGAVRALTGSRHPAERQLAVAALGALDDGASLALLERIAEKDESADVRMAAMRSLAAIDSRAYPPEFDLAGFSRDELERLATSLEADPAGAQALALVRSMLAEKERHD